MTCTYNHSRFCFIQLFFSVLSIIDVQFHAVSYRGPYWVDKIQALGHGTTGYVSL